MLSQDKFRGRVVMPRLESVKRWLRRWLSSIAFFVLLGLILGAAAVFIVEMYDNSFKRVEDIEEALQLPVLATIPKIERLKSIRQ